MKRHFFLLFTLCLTVFPACKPQASDSPTAVIATERGDAVFTIEIARTPQERQRGLMFRDHLGEYQGMWFVFDEPDTYRFWMKNTLIPLDIVYVNGELVISDILKADPCQNDPCPLYTPKVSALYVLELNQNSSDLMGIRIGDRVEIVE